MRDLDYLGGDAGQGALLRDVSQGICRRLDARQNAVICEVATAMRVMRTGHNPKRLDQAVEIIVARAPSLPSHEDAAICLFDAALFAANRCVPFELEAAVAWQSVFERVDDAAVRDDLIERGLVFAPEQSPLRDKVEAAAVERLRGLPAAQAYDELKAFARNGQIEDDRFLPLVIDLAENYTPFRVQKLALIWVKAASMRSVGQMQEGFGFLCNHISWLNQMLGGYVADVARDPHLPPRPWYWAEDFGRCKVTRVRFVPSGPAVM